MGLTALRNKRGIQGKPANRPGGNDPSTLNRSPKPAPGQVSGGADGRMAPRYQKMLDDGVDPSVVAKRAADFKAGQLPGQQGPSQPGQAPIQADRPAGGPLLPNRQPMAIDPSFSGSGQPAAAGGPAQPGFGAPLPGVLSRGPLVRPSGQTPGIVPPMAGGGAPPMAKPVALPNGGPMRSMIANEPTLGGSLSPGAWGALSGGATSPQVMAALNAARGAQGGAPPVIRPMLPNESGGNLPGGGGVPNPQLLAAALNAARGAQGGPGGGAPVLPNGQPMGGLQSGPMGPIPYGNDAQPRPMGGGLQSMNAGVPQPPPGGVGAPGAPDVQSLNGGGLQSGPTAGGMAAVPGDPQARQAAIVRGLAGRMAGGGGAFNQ